MNLWLRLLSCLMSAFWGKRLDPADGVSRLSFRVWPHDLDPSAHMNNGRYLTIMDLGRLDVLARSGLLKAAWRNGWTPIANAIQIRFRRELRLWQRFRLETRLVSWQTHLVIMEQRFIIHGGANDGQIAASALFKGGLYDRKTRRFVDVARLMSEIGVMVDRPAAGAEVSAFLASDEAMRQALAREQSEGRPVSG